MKPMSSIRTFIARLVGGVQCLLGAATSTFAYLVYASQSIRESLSIANEESFLIVFLLVVFGAFSILSGMVLIREED